MWCVAELNAEYVRKMEDVLAICEKPFKPSEPVVCLDEKPIPLHAEVRAPRPMRSGHGVRRDNEYKRCGVANIFAVVEPKAGKHLTCATPNRSAVQFATVVRNLVAAYPFARTIHLVMDNLNIHRMKSLTDTFGMRYGQYLWNRLTVHYTPKHGSWLNQAEMELSLLSRQCLAKRRIASLAELRTQTRAWARDANRRKLRINWNFTRKNARQKFNYSKESY